MMRCIATVVSEEDGGRRWPSRTAQRDPADKRRRRYAATADIKTGQHKGQVWSIVVDFGGVPHSGVFPMEFLVPSAPTLEPGDAFHITEGHRVVFVCTVVESE